LCELLHIADDLFYLAGSAATAAAYDGDSDGSKAPWGASEKLAGRRMQRACIDIATCLRPRRISAFSGYAAWLFDGDPALTGKGGLRRRRS